MLVKIKHINSLYFCTKQLLEKNSLKFVCKTMSNSSMEKSIRTLGQY